MIYALLAHLLLTFVGNTVEAMWGRAVCVCLVVLSLLGCAYHWSLADGTLPGGYRQIAIPVFMNRSQELGIEVDFTNAMIREFERSKVAQVVAADSAPVKLEGEILVVDIQRGALSIGTPNNAGDIAALPNQSVLATSYRMVVRTHLRLRRTSDSAVLWETDLNNEKVYQAPRIGSAVVNSANVLYNQSAKQINFAGLARDMMEEAHARMTENF